MSVRAGHSGVIVPGSDSGSIQGSAYCLVLGCVSRTRGAGSSGFHLLPAQRDSRCVVEQDVVYAIILRALKTDVARRRQREPERAAEACRLMRGWVTETAHGRCEPRSHKYRETFTLRRIVLLET
eukprot:6202755-Pleurochrysis_carterae.AAC.4